MKTPLKIASVLTWFNLIVWSCILILLLFSLFVMQTTAILFFVVLFSSIPLNCYAALRLHRSIRKPAVKLSSQTPTGIRFVGFVALFFAISFVVNGFTLAGNTQEAVKVVREGMAQIKNADLSYITPSYFRVVGFIAAFLGLCVGINVILNFRLLRWYYLVRQSDVRNNDDISSNDAP